MTHQILECSFLLISLLFIPALPLGSEIQLLLHLQQLSIIPRSYFLLLVFINNSLGSLHLCLVQTIDNDILPGSQPDLPHCLLLMEPNLTNIHPICLV